MAGRLTLVLVVGWLGIAQSLRSLHAWNSLFQSDASVHFGSDSSLFAAHEEYLNKISGDEQYTHTRRRHPFIVKFPAGCGISCHEAVKARVGSERHSILNSGYAQVTLRTEEVKALQKTLGESVVQDYTAMLPTLKVEHRSHALTQVDTTCAVVDAGERVFQVVLEAHEEAGLQYVHSLLDSVSSEFKTFVATSGSPASVTLHIDPKGLVAHQENVVTFQLHCVSGSDGGGSGSGDGRVISSSTVSHLVSLISSLPVVLWVEHRERFRTSNRWASGLCQSGDATVHPMFSSGLDGTGKIIGVSDTGIDMTHCQFYDANTSTPFDYVNNSHRKVVTYVTFADNTDDSDGHGTHVASTAAGKSNIQYGDFQRYDGNAKEAKIAFFDIGRTDTMSLTTPGNINTGLLKVLYDAGAKVSTHSWGSTANIYNTDARNVDQFMYSNPDALTLFAAGNRGQDGAMTVGAPSTNKNGISVGASVNSYDVMRAVMGPDISSELYSDSSMAGFSSKGPTANGRLKPDISAPGWYTVAAEAIEGASNDHCDIKTLRGTSMASPAVAGSAVLVQQYFNEGFYPTGSKSAADSFVPSGALLKAMLVHSGVSMDTVTNDDGSQASTGGYPSNIQGYGKVRLSNVLNFGESTNNPISLFVLGDTNTSSPMYASLSSTLAVNRYYIVTSATPPASLRVTMTYTDVPGTAGSRSPIVNDLQLRVTIGGTTHTPLLNGDSASNNIEMIIIDDPCASCNYTIEVRAASISSLQPYAVVATGVITGATFNATSRSSSYDADESIGTDTWKAIVSMSIVCVCLGLIVGYLHYFDAPAKKKLRPRTFEEEQREQAAALQYYEEQHRRRDRLPEGDVSVGGTSRRRGTATGGGSVHSDAENASSPRSRTPKHAKKKKKERRSSRTNRDMEMSERSGASSRV